MFVLRSLAAFAVLIVSLAASTGAEAGSRHHGARAYGGHSMHVVRSHASIGYVARPYTAHSYAPRVVHVAPRYEAPRFAPVRVHAVRHHHHHHQATYVAVRPAYVSTCVPRPHCVC
jgi:hypothetical protein